jgi:hypothetical protein
MDLQFEWDDQKQAAISKSMVSGLKQLKQFLITPSPTSLMMNYTLLANSEKLLLDMTKMIA